MNTSVDEINMRNASAMAGIVAVVEHAAPPRLKRAFGARAKHYRLDVLRAADRDALDLRLHYRNGAAVAIWRKDITGMEIATRRNDSSAMVDLVIARVEAVIADAKRAKRSKPR
jgi:hypothetical protein